MHEIRHNGKLLAIVDSVSTLKPGLSFYGDRMDAIQVGAFRYEEGKVMRDHRHLLRKRSTEKTQEVLVVLRGSVEARTFAETGSVVVDVRELKAGDFYISYFGGVGFTVRTDDTRMIEIKNGPYDVVTDDEERELI